MHREIQSRHDILVGIIFLVQRLLFLVFVVPVVCFRLVRKLCWRTSSIEPNGLRWGSGFRLTVTLMRGPCEDAARCALFGLSSMNRLPGNVWGTGELFHLLDRLRDELLVRQRALPKHVGVKRHRGQRRGGGAPVQAWTCASWSLGADGWSCRHE